MGEYSEYIDQLYTQLEGREGETISIFQLWHRLELPEIDKLGSI